MHNMHNYLLHLIVHNYLLIPQYIYIYRGDKLYRALYHPPDINVYLMICNYHNLSNDV